MRNRGQRPGLCNRPLPSAGRSWNADSDGGTSAGGRRDFEFTANLERAFAHPLEAEMTWEILGKVEADFVIGDD
jgi:hypothetical protein